MKTITITVLGPEVPCWNCKTLERIVNEVVASLDVVGVTFTVEHGNIASNTIKEKFGSLRSPAVVADSVILFQGQVPALNAVRRKIQDFSTLLA